VTSTNKDFNLHLSNNETTDNSSKILNHCITKSNIFEQISGSVLKNSN